MAKASVSFMDLWRRRVSTSFLKPKCEFKAAKLRGKLTQTQTRTSRIQVVLDCSQKKKK